MYLSDLGAEVQAVELDIARYLARQARDKHLTTYRELATAIGWYHPMGRGMGPYLQAVLEYTREHNLPCLTSTLVQVGIHSPTETGLNHIRQVYGEIDLSEEQARVFLYDWSFASGLGFQLPTAAEIDYDRIYATRTWGFDPQEWGMTGFSQEGRRDGILANMGDRPIYVVYFCSQHAEVIDPVEGRYTIAPGDVARVLGICELQPVKAGHHSHTAPAAVEQMVSDWGRVRWEYGLENSRAWALVARPWTHEVLPHARATSWEATNGIVELTDEEKRLLRQYQLREVPVFGKQMREVAFALREPMHTTYLAVCGDPSVLGKTSAPVGTKLVKIGVSGDTGRRLRDLNEHHFAKIFGLEFAMYATHRWANQDEALSGETTALEWALANATLHASGEYFYMTDAEITQALHLVKPAKRVR